MNEAYEIGVTLALSDGVSEGIERARRDMAQLERALQIGGVSVQRLRATAVGEAAPSKRPNFGRVDAVGQTPTPRLDQPEATRARPPVVSTEASTHSSNTGNRVVSVQTAEKAASVSHAGSPAWQVGTLPLEGLDRCSRVGRAEAVTTAPSGKAETGRVGIPAIPGKPVITLLQQTKTLEPGVSVRPQIGPIAPPQVLHVERRPQLVISDRAGAEASPVVPKVAPPAFVSQNFVGSQTGTGPLQPPLAPTDSHRPAERWGSSPAVGSPPSFAEQPAFKAQRDEHAPNAQTPAAPPASPGAHGVTEGDVFLDGMLVGRWMSRFLSQEAGRASAGPTGFDARRGRLLPGPTVGG